MTHKTLTRNQILKAKDMHEEWVPVPEWGEGASVLVTTWAAAQRDSFERIMVAAQAEGKSVSPRAIIVALSVIDPKTKKPLFTAEDIEALSQKRQEPMDRVFQKAAELNPINFGEVEEVVEDIAKNS